MRLARRLAAALLVVAASLPGVALAADVRAFALPAGFTVDPEAQTRAVQIAADGRLYALAEDRSTTGRAQAVRWDGDGTPRAMRPMRQRGDEAMPSRPRIEAIAAGSSGAFVSVSRGFDGAFIGKRFEVERWTADGTMTWGPPACAGSSNPIVAAVDGPRIAVTIDPAPSAPGPDLGVRASVEADLPNAFVIQDGRCSALGVAVVTDVRGAASAGYIGTIGGEPMPTNINLFEQTPIALRWIDGQRALLGPGVPFATTVRGLVVGASTRPGFAGQSYSVGGSGEAMRTYRFGDPHAVAWPIGRASRRLVSDDERSVAWDVSDDGTIVGMLQRRGKHYAFRRIAGRVQLLDDLPHPPGWRFESAYAIAPDGTIAGIGRLDNVPTVFLWHE